MRQRAKQSKKGCRRWQGERERPALDAGTFISCAALGTGALDLGGHCNQAPLTP